MKTKTIKLAKKAPEGTAAYATRWNGVVYAVAANWANASDPVLSLIGLEGEEEWDGIGWQVGDFSHEQEVALRKVMERDACDSGEDPESDEIADEIDAAIEAAQWVK